MRSRKAASPYLQRLCIRALQDTRLVRDLSPADLAASWLHPIVLQCKSAPLLWSLAEWPHLTVCQVAGRLLVAMLKLTRNSVQTVSKDLVIQLRMWELDPTTCSTTVAEVQVLKEAQARLAAANPEQHHVASSSTAAAAMHALDKAQQWFEALSDVEQYTAKATALFQCPPVVDRGPGRCIKFFTSCWAIRKKAKNLRCVEPTTTQCQLACIIL